MKSSRILVIEDEVIVAKNIQNRLQKLGYLVSDIVTSGDRSIKKVEETRPDLILMDIRLDGEIDGIEAVKQIQNNFDIPIVYLTAYADDKTLNRAKITAPYGYIIKPFNDRELQSNIEIALYKHKMEKILKENQKQLQNIINSASEIIISFDKKNNVITWNKATELLTGYKQREVIKKHISKLDVFDSSNNLVEDLKNLYKKKDVRFDRLLFKTKKGQKKIVRFTHSFIKDEKGDDIGILFIGNDITYQHENHQKLINGNSYYISNSDESSFEIFSDIVKNGYNGLIITRSISNGLEDMVSSTKIQIELLKQSQSEKNKIILNLDNLINKIEEFTKKSNKSVVLLDRIDYLITLFNFENFMRALYKINDIVSEKECILIVCVDPSLFLQSQLTIIKNELLQIPNKKIDDIEIEDDLFEILNYAHQQNINNSLVSFKKIRDKFSIAYSTTNIKLSLLEKKGLIFIGKHGRFKTVSVSDKGKSLLNNRSYC